MQKFRSLIERNPWAGWVVAVLILAASIFVYRQLSGSNDPYSIANLSEEVTLKCAESGEEWTMSRGEMERELRGRVGTIDPAAGLMNPKTGKPTGFPFSKSDWVGTIERLNGEKQELLNRKSGLSPATGSGKK